MPPNLEATKPRARHVWRWQGEIFVSFPDLDRAFRAISKLFDAGREAEYDGTGPGGRQWIRIRKEP